jgi:catechol 2,3-dioxygenase-like lactoylglutathione lyase family enzyme
MNIIQVATVFAPVADLERALAFYIGVLGWQKKVDFMRDDADSPVDTAVAGDGTSRPGLIGLDTEVRSPMPRQFSFRDPDGNRFLVVDNPAAD